MDSRMVTQGWEQREERHLQVAFQRMHERRMCQYHL